MQYAYVCMGASRKSHPRMEAMKTLVRIRLEERETDHGLYRVLHAAISTIVSLV